MGHPPSTTAGAQTNSINSVWINQIGPFFKSNTTTFIPWDRKDLTGNREVTFSSASGETMRAFFLLHELGHQVGVFGSDTSFPYINGQHSLKVLENCFTKKEVTVQQ